MIKVAVPNKGALSEDAVLMLKEAGYRCSRYSRELIVNDLENKIEFVFLRPRDIALYVGNGIVEYGITGRDLAIDSKANVDEILPLGFGHSRFCYAVPKNSGITVDKLDNLRIATSYPELLQNDINARGAKGCQIVKLDGAVEVSISLGVADAIADVVESGSTLAAAGLVIIGEPMMRSEAIIIGRKNSQNMPKEMTILLQRVRGVLLARDHAMIEYDIPRNLLEKCCKITPGVEAPTVSPLANADWVAVKALVLKKSCNNIMDELYELGAKGIIVSELSSCRM